MIEKEKLREYAHKLMFDMNDDEYETLQQEFEVILEQTFPFTNEDASLREDEVGDYLTVDEVLSNTKHQVRDQVKVPKVVE